MKVTAIIQARMGSTRLPGKVLMDLGGVTVLGRVVRRLQRVARISECVVATTAAPADDAIVEECRRLNVPVFRGSEDDVLDRYLQAARHFSPDAVVRITSDCPLIDPEVVDSVVRALIEQRADFACNVLKRTYPRGLDAEAFTIEALEKAWRNSDQRHQREHVTPLFYERPTMFRVASVHQDQDLSHYRWTLDTPDDLRLIREIYSHFDNRDHFGWRDVLALMERLPELPTINAHIVQKRVRDGVQSSV
jgi:spore coat polysaccharide biosynthesis protein SpsF